VERDFRLVVRGVVETSKLLQELVDIEPIPAKWLGTPPAFEGFAQRPDGQGHISRVKLDLRGGWIQHGDMTVENVFLDRKAKRVELIDWADLAAGLPPLYDLFSLLYSAAYLPPELAGQRYATEEDRWIASFNATFLAPSAFGRLACDLTLGACRELGVDPALIATLLVEYLLIRGQYYAARASRTHCRVHMRLLRSCLGPDGVRLWAQAGRQIRIPREVVDVIARGASEVVPATALDSQRPDSVAAVH
jgi:hypothetical protein